MIEVHTLGVARIDVHSPDRRFEITPAVGKRFGLLLYLAAQPGCRVARRTLEELLFAPARDSRHGLRELLYQLRRSGVSVQGDVHAVGIPTTAVRRDWIAITEGVSLTTSQLQSIQRGVLPGYRPSHSPAFAEWYHGFRAAIISDLCRRVMRHAETSLQTGDLAAAELAARTCLVLEPSNRHALLALARAVRR